MKKISVFFFSVLLLSSAVLFAQKAQMNPEAAKLYNQGNKQYKSGNYNGAIESYKKALAIERDAPILYQEGLAYKKLRKFKEAEADFTECIKLDPDFVPAYNGLGTTYYAMGEYLKAAENFKKFGEKTKKKKYKEKAKKFMGLAYTKLGVKESKNGNYKKAVEYLTKAIENYNYDAAYLELADVYITLGKYEEALKAANNAIKYRPRKSRVPKGAPYFYKGLAYKGMKDKTHAKQNFAIAAKDKLYKDRSKHEMKYMN